MNLYSPETARFLTGEALAEQTAAFLNAADPRCADFNEYGHGEQLARLLLAAYDAGALERLPDETISNPEGAWWGAGTQNVSAGFAASLAFAANDWGFDPLEVRTQLAGEPVDWNELSEYATEHADWINPRFTSAWWDAQEAYDEYEKNRPATAYGDAIFD